MRIAFILLLLSISSLLFSQNNFAKELNQIIKDSANHFSKFKGGFKEMHDQDSVFYSTMTLEGTRENDIIITQILTQYRSEIIDSINEKKGRKIIDEWHEKLVRVFTGKFQSEKRKIESWSLMKYGWSFKNGNTWVDISLLPINVNSSKYFVSLAVTYFSRDFYKLK